MKWSWNFIVQVISDDIELPLFDLAAITIATNNFSPANILGAGGFGPAYNVTNFSFFFFSLFITLSIKSSYYEVEIMLFSNICRGNFQQDKK